MDFIRSATLERYGLANRKKYTPRQATREVWHEAHRIARELSLAERRYKLNAGHVLRLQARLISAGANLGDLYPFTQNR